MNFYFSHSYRDVAINSYFMGHFVRDNVPLYADQKSETWCVAKLERYMSETSGFISIIPKRVSETDPGGYSPYIGHELDLARRARVPRLLFVDEAILDRHATRFPKDVIPFNTKSPEDDFEKHRIEIRQFLAYAMTTAPRLHPPGGRNEVMLVTDNVSELRRVGNEIEELLRRAGLSVRRILLEKDSPAIDDVRLLEAMWEVGLCIFLLGKNMAHTHVALGIAYAHCIPSLRLHYDSKAKSASPELNGTIRWKTEAELFVQLQEQLASFQKGFVEPVRMAQESSPRSAARNLGTTHWDANEKDLWNISDGPSLIHHVATAAPFVRDQMTRARKVMQADENKNFQGRDREFQYCRVLYDQIKEHHLAYEIEPQEGTPVGVQKIRSPVRIFHSNAATCIDMACLFAALLEASGFNALIVVLQLPSSAHALVGYRAADAPPWSDQNLGELRFAHSVRDAILFEPTGPIEAEDCVTNAEKGERLDNRRIDFLGAQQVASRLITSRDTKLMHLVDVRSLRQSSHERS